MQAFFDFLSTLVGFVFFFAIFIYLIKFRDASKLKRMKNRIFELERELANLKQNQMQTPFYTSKKITLNNTGNSDNEDVIEEDMVVVGVTFENDDKINRQEILKRCKAGMKIELKRTPMKKYPNAIGVFSPYGQIGNISEDENEEIAEHMDRGGKIEDAVIKKITGGTKGKPTLGCVITFSWNPNN